MSVSPIVGSSERAHTLQHNRKRTCIRLRRCEGARARVGAFDSASVCARATARVCVRVRARTIS
eukprot:6191657-Pleurochrysis_carterae.AAC.1